MTEKYQSREERRKKQLAAKQEKKKKPKGTKKPKGSLFTRILLILVVLGIIGIISGAATFAYMVKDTPQLDKKTLKAEIPSEIYGSDGELITEIGVQKLKYVDYEDIPDLVKEAVIATEDSRFFKHHGLDPIRLTGAVIANFTDGFGAEGGSTITQQVAKMHFLTYEKTLSRKAQEAWLAIQLERSYTKEEIFELYVNKVFMSQRSVGIATAAEVYFGKELEELTLPEAALIAGLPQSPNNYNPFNHPENAEKRKDIVLSLMHQHGFITQSEMKDAQETPITNFLLAEEERQQHGDIPYDPFIGQAIKEIENKYPDLNVYTDGLKIYTTLDTNAQDFIDRMLYDNEIVPLPDDKFQAGITLLDTKTGEIRAIGGSRNKEIDFGLNFATAVPRQPGSTIKPILDYGPAVEHLKWATYQRIVDEPYRYSTGQTINNWDMGYKGDMTIRQALASSRNIPALKAMQAAGLENAKEFANRLGLGLKDIYEPYAIGGFSHGVTSLQMAGAYSAFGNNGYYTEPHAVREIVFRDGTKANMKPKTEAVMSDYTAFIISDMLKSAVSSSYGTGRTAIVPGLQIAGKTGTTNYSSQEKQQWGIRYGGVPDIWFAGYTTNYTISVWTGYQERKNSIASRDQGLAKIIFRELLAHVSKDVHTPDFTMPDSVQRVGSEYAVKGHAPKVAPKKQPKKTTPPPVEEGTPAENENPGEENENLSEDGDQTEGGNLDENGNPIERENPGENGKPIEQNERPNENGNSNGNSNPNGNSGNNSNGNNGQNNNPSRPTDDVPTENPREEEQNQSPIETPPNPNPNTGSNGNPNGSSGNNSNNNSGNGGNPNSNPGNGQNNSPSNSQNDISNEAVEE